MLNVRNLILGSFGLMLSSYNCVAVTAGSIGKLPSTSSISSLFVCLVILHIHNYVLP